MSSDVNNVGSLTIEIMLLLAAVDCSLYNNADGSDAQRPFAALAIVGADMRIDCVLNHASSNSRCLAA